MTYHKIRDSNSQNLKAQGRNHIFPKNIKEFCHFLIKIHTF